MTQRRDHRTSPLKLVNVLMEDISQQRKSTLQQVGDNPQNMEGATVAIVRGNNPCVAQHGTGILFAVAERYFVVTAGHVLIEARKIEADLGISSALRGFVATPGPWIVSKNVGGTVEESMIDIALYELNPSQRAALGGKVFLKLTDVAFEDNWETASFVLFGFPQMLCDSTTSEEQPVGLGALKFLTGQSRASTVALERYDPIVHFLLDAGDNGLFDENGNDTSLRGRAPHTVAIPLHSGLKGISGCPVWRLSKRGQAARPARPEHWLLVGVQTGTYTERKAIKVTKWRAVMELMQASYPDLKPALRLMLPRAR